MKAVRFFYIIAWLMPLALVGLYLLGTIGPARQCADETANYIVSISTVALSLLVAYLAMKMHRLPIALRIAAVLVMALADLAAFYFTGSTSPLYLAAIMGVALIFCWPQDNNQ